MEHLPWSEGKRRMTCAMMGFLARWGRGLSWRETALVFQTSGAAVYRSVEWFVHWGRAQRQLEGVESLGVDEIPGGRGLQADNFLTVIYQIDAHGRRRLWVGRRRSKATLRRGLKARGPEVISGLILLWRATAARSDLYRTLQISTGAFLAAFIVSHLNAVFILGRAVTKVDTTFLWASGAAVGLMPDAWNVRLIPHYSLGVWFVIAHIGLGLRGVLLAHQVSPPVADRAAWAVGALGTAFALTITIAQLRVHGAS